MLKEKETIIKKAEANKEKPHFITSRNKSKPGSTHI